MTGLIVRSRLCTGCKICELTCSFVKEGGINSRKSRIHIAHPGFAVTEVLYCTQCGDCVKECPENALQFNRQSGAITLAQERCTGCGLCIGACPTGYLKDHPLTGHPLICDLCHGEPQCAENCPAEAIKARKEEVKNG